MRNNGRVSLFLLCLLLSFGKNVFAEIPLGVTKLGPAPNGKLEPAIASDGRDFFAVWRDARTGRSEEVLGARIAADGTVLDPTGIRLGSARPVHAPRVIFLGNAYQVFWSTWSTQTGSGQLWMTRVGRDGNVLAPPRAIAEGPSLLGSYVATNGRIAVAAYVGETSDSPVGTAIHTVALDAEGNVLGHQHLTPPDVNRYHLSVTAIGDQFLAVWNSFHVASSQIEGVRLNADGERIDTVPQILGAGYDAEIAGDGTYTLAVIRHAAGNDLSFATRLIRNDLDWVSTARSIPNGAFLSDAQVLRHGAGYLVVATESHVDTRALLMMRVDAEGSPTFASSIALLPVSGVNASPRMASNGSEVMVVWVESNDSATQGYVRAQRVDPNALAARGPRIEVARSAQRQSIHDVATDGTTLVVWAEDDLLLAQRGSDAPIELARGTQLSPARVVFDGTSFIVAWSNRADSTVNVRFLDRTTGLGPQLTEATHTPGTVALVTNATSTLLAWSRGESRQIVAMSIGRQTRTFETAQRPISPDSMRAEWPAAAWNGTNFLVAWSELEYVANDDSFFGGGYESQRIRGTRVDRTLVPLDPASRVLADMPEVRDSGALLASNRREWLLGWTAQPAGSTDAVARARRLRDDLAGHGSESGVRIGEGVLEGVAFDGERYVAVWTLRDEARLAYLTSDGIPHQPVLIATAEPIDSLAFVPLGPGTIHLAYSRVSWAPEHGGVSRAFLKLVQIRMKTRPVR